MTMGMVNYTNQAYLPSDGLAQMERAILDQPQVGAANTGGATFAGTDGQFSSTLTGDGDDLIASPTDAALALY